MQVLGKGGFGEVYLAHDNELDQSVAIKIESPTNKKPVLKQEISILRKFNKSPYKNLVCEYITGGRFFCEGYKDPFIYLVMSLVGSKYLVV
jgi:serine/threonine protein kinase